MSAVTRKWTREETVEPDQRIRPSVLSVHPRSAFAPLSEDSPSLQPRSVVSISGSVDEQYGAGVKCFDAGDFQGTIRILMRIKANPHLTGKKGVILSYCLGMALLSRNKWEEAIPYLDIVEKSPSVSDIEKANIRDSLRKAREANTP